MQKLHLGEVEIDDLTVRRLRVIEASDGSADGEA